MTMPHTLLWCSEKAICCHPHLLSHALTHLPTHVHTHPQQHHTTQRNTTQPTGAQLTALRFDPGGLQLAVGTSNGLVGLWDLRQTRPLLVKDHMYGDAIRDIKFHSAGVSLSECVVGLKGVRVSE